MLPLHHFFRQLQRHGFHLGVDDYTLLFDALNGGYGLGSQGELKELCRMLWFKPGQSLELFEDLFDRSFEQELARLAGEDLPALPEVPETERLGREKERLEAEEKKRAKELEAEASQELLEEELEVSDERIILSIRSTAQRTGALNTGPEVEMREAEAHEFLFLGGYRPMSERQMALSWRFLRHQGSKVPTRELNIPATVDHIARHDRLITPIFHETYLNDVRLWVLIDYSSSMVAFHGLAEVLAASTPGGKAESYFFRNVPSDFLYRDPAFAEALSIEDLRQHHIHRKAAILIVSDAGAARGTYHPQRVIDTRAALEALVPMSTGIAWLNPVPRVRWEGTSAAYIQRLLVPMFEANESGLYQAVNVLRGKNRKVMR